MSTKYMKNIHVPLTQELYRKLRDEAKKEERPATEIARNAIQKWLEERERIALHESISDYAIKNAGTVYDYDEELSNASIEHITASEADE